MTNKMMRRALELARHGELDAAPNPMVGAVIADDSGMIMGEGWHRCYGQGHAEVNAVAQARNRGIEDFSNLTIYVTLEPCSHYGQTPPCAKLLASLGFKKVVVGCMDPNPKVMGQGIKMIKDAGIEVEMAPGDVMKQCRELNQKFLFACEHADRPFVTLKWAQRGNPSLAGPQVENITGHISSPSTQALAHRLRATHDAILVGSGTVLADDPSLTTRCYAGKDPLRVVLDRSGRVPSTVKVFNDDNVVYFSNKLRTDLPLEIQHPACDDFLKELKKMGVTSVLVEGGAQILNYFISHGLYDQAHVEYRPQ